MKKNTVILIFLTILLAIFSVVVAAEDLNIMTYNIRHGKGMDDKVDLDRIAKIIEKSDADIIGLQEVDKETSRVNYIDTPKYIAEKLGMNYAYGPNIYVLGGEYGNAIISRYPIVSYKNYTLRGQSGIEPRGFLLAKIKVGDQIVNFASTHLTVKSNKLRLKQVQDILEITEEIKEPLVIVGDLNSHAVTAPIMLLARKLNDAQNLYKLIVNYQELSYEDVMNDNLTFPALNPQSRIDYVFLSENLMLDESINGFKVIPSQGSDHLPVMAKVKLPFNNSPQLDVGIIKSEKMTELSVKLKLPYQEGIDNASQLLEYLDYNYQLIESSKLNMLDLSQVKLLILPDLRYLSTVEKYKLIDYSLNGGKILALNQVGIKPDLIDNSEFFADILGIKYIGWNHLRPLHGLICKANDHPIWKNISENMMMDTHEGMIVGTTESGKVLGEWYNDFQIMPSHPDYKNGAIIEGKNSIYIAKNLFLEKNFRNDEIKKLLANCVNYLLEK